MAPELPKLKLWNFNTASVYYSPPPSTNSNRLPLWGPNPPPFLCVSPLETLRAARQQMLDKSESSRVIGLPKAGVDKLQRNTKSACLLSETASTQEDKEDMTLEPTIPIPKEKAPQMMRPFDLPHLWMPFESFKETMKKPILPNWLSLRYTTGTILKSAVSPRSSVTPLLQAHRTRMSEISRQYQAMVAPASVQKAVSSPASVKKAVIPEENDKPLQECDLCMMECSTLIDLDCGHGKTCANCMTHWSKAFVLKGKAVRCPFKPTKCAQVLTSELLEKYSAASNEIVSQYKQLEAQDTLLSQVVSGSVHRCICGKVYQRSGGFCSTAVCQNCSRGFCFHCHKTLRVIGRLKHAEPHLCPAKKSTYAAMVATDVTAPSSAAGASARNLLHPRQ